jgi:phosphomannomutase
VGNLQTIRFGTDGWRGIIADDFTFANVQKVTRAIASYLEATYGQERPVLVAYDTRFLADQFARTAADVLLELGWTVKLVERDCPTPVIAYNAYLLQSAGALMFTASHNPASYCGIKYIPDYGGPATTEITNQIEARIAEASDAAPTGTKSDRLSIFDPRPAYLQFLYTLLDVECIRKAKLSVVYDALYSTSRGYLDTVLQTCDCAINTLHDYRDVLFGGRMPEPRGAQLAELVNLVRRSQASVGLATDGDSDRFGIVDEQGTILNPNVVLLLLTWHLVHQKGRTGAIVRTVATTRLLDNLAAAYGLPLYETPVGFKYISEKMRQTPVLIGGEESGGLSILGHIPEKDGILASMLVVEAIAYAGKPLSQLVAEVVAVAGGPLYYNRLDLHLAATQQQAILNTWKTSPPTELAGLRVTSISDRDGIKLYLENKSWVLLRPSGTEPLLRVAIEANSALEMNQLTQALEVAISI